MVAGLGGALGTGIAAGIGAVQLNLVLPRSRGKSPQKRENPLWKRVSTKRLMGLEPTTFCMAIV
jgi:hypothetical protein